MNNILDDIKQIILNAYNIFYYTYIYNKNK